MNIFRKAKIGKIALSAVGLTMAVMMVFGVAATPIANAAELSLSQFVELLITLGIVPADKVDAARAAVSTPPSVSSSEQCDFTRSLTIGSRDNADKDVTCLQNYLKSEGHFTAAATGYFGPITKTAVAAWQADQGVTPAAGYFGLLSRTKYNELMAEEEVVSSLVPAVSSSSSVGSSSSAGSSSSVAATSTMSVILSPDSPLSGAIIQGQAIADLAHFAFQNNTGTEAKITKVVLTRTGISNDSTLSNVHLFIGAKRVADSATVSSGIITFNDSSGLFTVPAGSSNVISVRADIAGSTSGQIVGVSLKSVESTVAVSGVLPIAGNQQSIASATLAGVAFPVSVTPATASIDPQDDYVMWQGNVSVTTRAVNLKSLTFRQIGSVTASDLQNLELFIGSVKVGSTVASLDSNGYVTFDLSASPVKMETGTRAVKLIGDIIGGSTRTFSFSLRQASDAMFLDSELGQPVLITGNDSSTTGTFSARTTGTQTINAGTLTIIKKTDSPSGNINPDASNVTLAIFELKAAGEPIKVESITARADVSTANVGNLRNGALFACTTAGGCQQVGSTQNIADAAAGTQFNLGSALTVSPGSLVTLEVRADVYDNDGTNNAIVSGDTITASIVAGSNNLQRTKALTYFSNSAVSGNTRTVAVGALTGSKYSAFANQTTVMPKTAYKIGDFRVTANSAEGSNINSITLALGGDAVATDLSDIYIKYGSKTTSVKSAGAASQSWNISEPIAANATMTFEVYATMSSSIAISSTTIATLTVAGTSDSAASVTTGAITGQTITVAGGSITAAALSDSTVATKLLVGGSSGVKVASFRFTAINETFKVTDIALKVTNANSSGAITNVILKLGTLQLGTISSFNSVFTATSTGLALSVPANDSSGALVDVYLDLNAINANAATSTANVKVTLEGFKYQPATGGTEAEFATDQNGQNMYVVKTKPTVEMVSAGSSIALGSGAVFGKVKISTDPANQVGWKKLVFTITKSALVTLGATSTLQLVDSGNNVITGTFATTTGSLVGGIDTFGALTSGTISFVATSEQQISTSETYSLKGNVADAVTSGTAAISVSVVAPATGIATPNIYSVIAGAAGSQTPSLVWSDRSSNSHSETTPDWIDDYKAGGLPTSPATLQTNH